MLASLSWLLATPVAALRASLGVSSNLLTHFYNVSLADLTVSEAGPAYARAMSAAGVNDDYFVGPTLPGDSITLCDGKGGGWDGVGAGELLGVWQRERGGGGWMGPSRHLGWDTGGVVTSSSGPSDGEPEPKDTYDTDTLSIRSQWDTALRCICLKMMLHGEAFLRKWHDSEVYEEGTDALLHSDDATLPPNIIPMLNLVRYVGEVEVIQSSSSQLTVYGEMVGEMIRAVGEATAAGWGGGGANKSQKLYGDEWRGGICGRIVDVLEGTQDLMTKFDQIVSKMLLQSQTPIESLLFNGGESWKLFYSVVMESLIDQKRPAKAIEYYDSKFSDADIPPLSVCESYIAACCAQAYLEKVSRSESRRTSQ